MAYSKAQDYTMKNNKGEENKQKKKQQKNLLIR